MSTKGRPWYSNSKTQPSVKIKKTTVYARSVACPECKRIAGDFCVSATGNKAGYHRSRMRMATRVQNRVNEKIAEVNLP